MPLAYMGIGVFLSVLGFRVVDWAMRDDEPPSFNVEFALIWTGVWMVVWPVGVVGLFATDMLEYFEKARGANE